MCFFASKLYNACAYQNGIGTRKLCMMALAVRSFPRSIDKVESSMLCFAVTFTDDVTC